MEVKKYIIDGVIVEAVLTEGGGFYDVQLPGRSVKGNKIRVRREVFEAAAIPFLEEKYDCRN